MAYSPSAHDRGTHVTNYSSIHSADAFVGDYQVMYTPGSTSPPVREKKRSTRFSRATTSKNMNINQSYLLPSNIPNTSQILPDHGPLPQVQVHYTIPADEKQIVASLRSLQNDLNTAMETIAELTRERDEALYELRVFRATSGKPSTTPRKTVAARVEEELFDISRVHESPKRSPTRQTSNKKVLIEPKQLAKTQNSDNARVLSSVPTNLVATQSPQKRVGSRFVDHPRHQHQQQSKKPAMEDTEQSIVVAEDPTAASNTSRRRHRHSLEDNMTSAYILPDITVAQQAQKKPSVSKQAQNVIHEHHPHHLNDCHVCQRLLSKKNTKASAKPDFTAQLTEIMRNAALEEHTIRPKIPPSQALANVKRLLTDQFEEAKRKHGIAWHKYDDIEAPSSSKKHSAVGQDLGYWAKKMEECRINLDQLRDVEEGMLDSDEM